MRLARPLSRARALALLLLAFPGCAPQGAERLIVATSWPVAVRTRLETEFGRWVEESQDRLGQERIQLKWISLATGDDPWQLSQRAHPPQVFLGGRATRALLENSDRLVPIEHAGSARWCTVSCPSGAEKPGGLGPKERERPGDPRVDSASLAWGIRELSRSGWREGYAGLIRRAAVGERFAPSAASGLPSTPYEPVVIVQTASKDDMAQTFLRFLCETQGATAADGRAHIARGC